MAISMYEVSIPRFIHTLGVLGAIIDKAKAYAEARKLDADVLPSARLYCDMLPLTAQVQIACDTAKAAACRLSGVTNPVFEDNEKTLADLRARVDKTIAFLKTFEPEQIDGTEDKELVVKIGGQDRNYRGMPLLLNRSIPNFYFHVTTAYDILRSNGVEIGKKDYLGNV